jgi:hypothetical protein
MRNRLACAAVLVVIICCLQLGAPRPALACYCAPPANPADAIRQSDVIFSGSIVSIAMPPPNPVNGVYSPALAEFSVASVWKGTVGRKVTLNYSPSEASCGYDFQAGADYLVYAHSYVDGPALSIFGNSFHLPFAERKLTTGICMRTRLLSTAQQDLAVLGQGASPTARGLLDIVLDNLLAVVAVVVALLIVLVLYLLRRRRRRSFRLKP